MGKLLVSKRNGRIVPFQKEKIIVAISKAMNESDDGVDTSLAARIADDIEELANNKNEPLDIEEIQDQVELGLMSTRPEVAKRYIIYREERAKARSKGWDNMTDLQKDIYEQKYRSGSESFDEFLDRVSDRDKYIASAIRNKEFMPAGRILAGRGVEGRKLTTSNCYVLGKPLDNLESIFDIAKYMARTYSYGGGVGVDISNLRPSGAPVNNAAKTTTGAVSFMDLYSLVTGLIGQNNRRGALMLNMDVSHPDIENFIEVKNDLDKVTNANISVNIYNDFMEAVKNNDNYTLKWKDPDNNLDDITKEVNARELFLKISKNNWNMAEPGVLFKDRLDSWHMMSEDPEFEYAGTNPCGEQPLPSWGSCNLASINLGELVIGPYEDHASLDMDKFVELIDAGVTFLDNILDYNMYKHPLEQQTETAKKYRQIGLGIMGLADMFIKLGMEYGSDESLALLSQIGEIFINRAARQSALLAKEKGTFPEYNEEYILNSEFVKSNFDEYTIELIKKYGLRNSQLLTTAPTGSISTLIGASNGIEPLFQISYTRKTKSLYGEDRTYKVYSPVVEEYMKHHNITDEEDLPDFITNSISSKLDYKQRIDVQATWQYYIDAAISSTVNLPEETTIEEVAEIYMHAWEKGCKGITVYRDNCARGGILTTGTSSNKKEEIEELQAQLDKAILESLIEDPNTCPLCGGQMIHSGGCGECQDCGYSPCAV